MKKPTKTRRPCASEIQNRRDYKPVVTVRNQGQRGMQGAAVLAVYKLDPRVRGQLPLTTAGCSLADESFSSEGWTGSESGFAFATAGRVLRGGPFAYVWAAACHMAASEATNGGRATKAARKEKPK